MWHESLQDADPGSLCLLLLYPNYQPKQLMFAGLLSCCGIRVSKTSRQSSDARCGSISLLYFECSKGFQPRPMSRGSLSPFGLCMQKRRTITCVWGYIFTSSCCNSFSSLSCCQNRDSNERCLPAFFSFCKYIFTTSGRRFLFCPKWAPVQSMTLPT